MTKHIHVHLHDAATVPSTSTQKTAGGVTVWGPGDPKKIVPKSPIDELREKSKDAGTSEGAKKAAQTRKAHGGGQFTGNKHLPLKNEQGHALYTHHSSSGPVGQGYHKDLTEARAEAVRKHGPGSYATYGHSSPIEPREPNRKRGIMPD